VLPFQFNPQDTIMAAEELLLKRKWVNVGSRLIILSDLMVNDKTVFAVQMRIVGS
jgi:hypothetical protein